MSTEDGIDVAEWRERDRPGARRIEKSDGTIIFVEVRGDEWTLDALRKLTCGCHIGFVGSASVAAGSTMLRRERGIDESVAFTHEQVQEEAGEHEKRGCVG